MKPSMGSASPAVEATVAVIVTGCPTWGEVVEKERVVLVLAAPTRELVVVDVASVWSESPGTTALRVCPPGRSAELRSTETVAVPLVM